MTEFKVGDKVEIECSPNRKISDCVVVNIVSYGRYPVRVVDRCGQHYSFTLDGRFFSRDAVSLKKIDQPVEVDYVAALAQHQQESNLYIKLYNSDTKFKAAADKLAGMLAHALLTKGHADRRKKKQSVMLWRAAIHVLSKNGCGPFYYDDNVMYTSDVSKRDLDWWRKLNGLVQFFDY